MLKTKMPTMPFVVGYLNYPPSDLPHGGLPDPFEPVARFRSEGEANAYAQWAYVAFPAPQRGHVRVYEIYKGKRKLRRIG